MKPIHHGLIRCEALLVPRARWKREHVSEWRQCANAANTSTHPIDRAGIARLYCTCHLRQRSFIDERGRLRVDSSFGEVSK